MICVHSYACFVCFLLQGGLTGLHDFGFNVRSSTLYHSLFLYPMTGRVLQVLDHAAINLLIAGTYTPFLLFYSDAWWTMRLVLIGRNTPCIMIGDILGMLNSWALKSTCWLQAKEHILFEAYPCRLYLYIPNQRILKFTCESYSIKTPFQAISTL